MIKELITIKPGDMTEQEQKFIDELLYWLSWTTQQQPGKETEILYVPHQMGAVIINLN